MKKGFLIFTVLLTACTTNQPIKGTAVDAMNTELHQGIAANDELIAKSKNKGHHLATRALMPGLKVRQSNAPLSQQRFDISVKDVPAHSFYNGLVADTSINMVVSPAIKGNVSLNLKQVTIEQVLQALEDVYGYAYISIPGGYEIVPNQLESKIYTVNYLELQRQGRSNMSISSGEVTPDSSGNGSSSGSGFGSSNSGGSINNTGTQSYSNSIGDVETKSTIDFWKSLQKTLETIIGKTDGRSVTVNPLAGVVVVHALPKELKQVERYLDMVQSSMDRQVILEAKILEVTLNNEFQMGIDWKIFGGELNSLSNFPQVDITQITFPKAYQANIKWNPQDFTTFIQALEMQGNVQVLSSPRVASMNNQKAVIKVGSDEFFVTNISQNQNIVSSGLATQPTQNVDLTPFFSGITLDVTPQIDNNGEVTLHIHPAVSLVKDQRKVIDLGTQGGTLNLPLANSTIRESDTIVHAKNNQVVVIGGLMQNQTVESIGQLPWFGNVPFLGTLVRATKQTSRKSELVILIKPILVTQASNNKGLIESTSRVRSLKQGFHFGGRPDIYGTEGEAPVTFGPQSGRFAGNNKRG